MGRFTPNKYSRAVLAGCALLAVVTLAYGIAHLAIGHTYLPGRRGGLLLPGIPTLLVAVASLLCCVVALSVVVDHYDERRNEPAYRRARRWMLKAAIALLLFAPFAELCLLLLHAMGGPAPLQYRGFAADVALHVPALAHHGEWVGALARSPVLLWTGAGTLVLALLLAVAGKLRLRIWPQVQALVMVATCLLLGVFMSLGVAEDWLRGEVSLRRQGVLTAIEQPAAFNAVLLAQGLVALLLLAMGVLALWVFVRRGARAFDVTA